MGWPLQSSAAAVTDAFWVSAAVAASGTRCLISRERVHRDPDPESDCHLDLQCRTPQSGIMQNFLICAGFPMCSSTLLSFNGRTSFSHIQKVLGSIFGVACFPLSVLTVITDSISFLKKSKVSSFLSSFQRAKLLKMHRLGLLTEFDEALSPLRSALILSGWKIFPPAVSFCIYHSNLCTLKSAACLLEGLSFLTCKTIRRGRRADLLYNSCLLETRGCTCTLGATARELWTFKPSDILKKCLFLLSSCLWLHSLWHQKQGD